MQHSILRISGRRNKTTSSKNDRELELEFAIDSPPPPLMEEFEEEFMKYTYIKLATVIEKSGGDK